MPRVQPAIGVKAEISELDGAYCPGGHLSGALRSTSRTSSSWTLAEHTACSAHSEYSTRVPITGAAPDYYSLPRQDLTISAARWGRTFLP